MATANHSSSKLRSLLLWGAVLALTGCASHDLFKANSLRLSTLAAKDDVRIVKTPLKPTIISANDKSDVKRELVITPAAAKPDKIPAWCEYLLEDTAAQTTIMRSPTLSGSVADDGKSNVSLGMSLTDFAKARVLEDTAEARCRRYIAESGLHKLVFLSPQELTSAGYNAKSKSIMARKKDIQALRQQVARAMNNGDVDREKATQLMGLADQLMTEAAKARSQADRRATDFLGAKDRAGLLGRELLRAEADLEDLNSRMRTFDNVDVSVSAGWSDDVSSDRFAVQSDDFGARMSVSVKLGALAPKRFDHEEHAKQAKLRAVTEEGGALWQIRVLRLAHERAIEGLAESAVKIDAAIVETNKLLAALKGVPNPEFASTAIGAKFQLYMLQADKAAVQGSIAEIRTNLKRLKTDG
jgi:hypothetical protein